MSEQDMLKAVDNLDLKFYQGPDGSISVTKSGALCIEVGSHCIVYPIADWHKLGKLRSLLRDLAD